MDKSLEKVKKSLKNKKIIFSGWNILRKDDNPYQNWYLPLRDTFDRVISFDTAQNYFRYGKIKMNNLLLNMIAKEKPDYVLFLLIYDEIDPLIFREIKKISPNTITLNIFSDDDWRYEDFSRFYALLIDYPIVNITDYDMDKPYKRDGINNLSLSLGMNCNLFKPVEINKEYDVSFVGRPNKSRVKYIKFLLDNKIKIKVWGDGWGTYPEISEAYIGKASAEEMVNITNKSKINLSFTQGGYGKMQMKGRLFEISACKGFTLVEYFKIYNEYFKENKEIIMFKNEEELLNKINYYLVKRKNREKIASASYLKTLKKYNKHIELLNYFDNIEKHETELKKKIFPVLNRKVYEFNLNILKKEKNLGEIINDFEYISFSSNNSKIHPMKKYLQVYSLEKSGKDISCCDYYVTSKKLKNFLLFKAKQAHVKLKPEYFVKCIYPSQIIVRKKYFIENLSKFIDFLNGKELNLINESNTSFVSIPLLSIKNFPNLEYKEFKNSFQMKFFDKLYSLFYQRKILFHYYPYLLTFLSLKYSALRKVLLENIKDKRKVSKLKEI